MTSSSPTRPTASTPDHQPGKNHTAITVATCKYELPAQLATVKAPIQKEVPFDVSNYMHDKTAQSLSRKHGYSEFPVVYCTNPDGNVFHSWCGRDAE